MNPVDRISRGRGRGHRHLNQEDHGEPPSSYLAANQQQVAYAAHPGSAPLTEVLPSQTDFMPPEHHFLGYPGMPRPLSGLHPQVPVEIHNAVCEVPYNYRGRPEPVLPSGSSQLPERANPTPFSDYQLTSEFGRLHVAQPPSVLMPKPLNPNSEPYVPGGLDRLYNEYFLGALRKGVEGNDLYDDLRQGMNLLFFKLRQASVDLNKWLEYLFSRIDSLMLTFWHHMRKVAAAFGMIVVYLYGMFIPQQADKILAPHFNRLNSAIWSVPEPAHIRLIPEFCGYLLAYLVNRGFSSMVVRYSILGLMKQTSNDMRLSSFRDQLIMNCRDSLNRCNPSDYLQSALDVMWLDIEASIQNDHRYMDLDSMKLWIDRQLETLFADPGRYEACTKELVDEAALMISLAPQNLAEGVQLLIRKGLDSPAHSYNCTRILALLKRSESLQEPECVQLIVKELSIVEESITESLKLGHVNLISLGAFLIFVGDIFNRITQLPLAPMVIRLTYALINHPTKDTMKYLLNFVKQTWSSLFSLPSVESEARLMLSAFHDLWKHPLVEEPTKQIVKMITKQIYDANSSFMMSESRFQGHGDNRVSSLSAFSNLSKDNYGLSSDSRMTAGPSNQAPINWDEYDAADSDEAIEDDDDFEAEFFKFMESSGQNRHL